MISLARFEPLFGSRYAISTLAKLRFANKVVDGLSMKQVDIAFSYVHQVTRPSICVRKER